MLTISRLDIADARLLIAAAREQGCGTMTGAHMFARVRDLMVDFLLGAM